MTIIQKVFEKHHPLSKGANRHNLTRLAVYAAMGGRPGVDFNMAVYADSEHDSYAPECGTVGCLVGHAPYAGIHKTDDTSWDEFSHIAFGLSRTGWEWAFSSNWSIIKGMKTIRAGAWRLAYMLTHGTPSFQSFRISPVGLIDCRNLSPVNIPAIRMRKELNAWVVATRKEMGWPPTSVIDQSLVLGEVQSEQV